MTSRRGTAQHWRRMPGGLYTRTPLDLLAPSQVIEWWRADRSVVTGATFSWTGQKSGAVVSQATGASQPTVEPSGINGRRSILFDGVDDYLSGAASVASALNGNDTPFSLYLVLQFVTVPAAQRSVFTVSQAGSGSVYDYTGHTAAGALASLRQAGDAQTAPPATGAFSPSTTYVVRKLFAGQTTTAKVNTTTVISAGAQDNATMGTSLDTVTFGAAVLASVPTQFTNVRLADALITVPLSASDDAALGGYFLGYYGVANG